MSEPAIRIWQVLLAQFHRHDTSWKAKINLHEDNTTAIHAVRTGKNPTMKTLERKFGVEIGAMHDDIVGEDSCGTSTFYNLIHTTSKHMSADIYTKGFVDKNAFGALKQLINIFSPEQLTTGDFNPSFPGEELPVEKSGWLNSHYHFIMSGESTDHTDFRKAIKPKSPKAKAKVKPLMRPRPVAPMVTRPQPTTTTTSITPATRSDPTHLATAAGGQNQCPYDVEWTVILLCTDKDSYLKTMNPFPKCNIIEITAEDDFTSEYGLS